MTDENGTDVLDIGRRLLDAASSVTGSLHGPDGESKIKELPQFCCDTPVAQLPEGS